MSSRRLLALGLIGASLLAGCGGESSLSREDYVARMQQIQQDPGGQTQALGSAIADPRLGREQWERAADAWLARQRAALDEVKELKAPSDVAVAHEGYVVETERWLDSMARLIEDVKRGSVSRADVRDRARRLGVRYSIRVAPIAEAIEGAGYDVFQPFSGGSGTG